MRLPVEYSAGSISADAVRTGFQRQNAPNRILERLRGILEHRLRGRPQAKPILPTRWKARYPAVGTSIRLTMDIADAEGP